MRPTLLLALAMSVAPVLSTARAAEFSFTVPVDLSNLSPGVKAYLVQCQVYNKKPGSAPDWQMVGFSGSPFYPVPAGKGAVKTTHKIEFDHVAAYANSGAEAKWYQCDLSLCPDTSNYNNCAQPVMPAKATQNTPKWAIAPAGATIAPLAAGPLP